jgi:hypothetical protein
MRKSTITKLTLVIAMFGVALAFAAPHVRDGRRPLDNNRSGRHVDLVIALDVSGSMDGLIDSARQKLWDTVNLLAQAKPQPVLRVGLISYGNDGYPVGRGWVRKDSDLTADLDGIYARLFALRTNGGTEYVARAVHVATTEMEWSSDPDALRIVFVAGNEPANQDPIIPVASAMREARQKGIYVNTIYCGTENNAEAVGWREAASQGGGHYAAIDQNHVLAIATPMDAELARLSAALNETYVAYGAEGGRYQLNQAAQDKNASVAGAPAAAARAVAKSNGLYRADTWDLVDARKAGKKVDLQKESLPESMRGMSEGQAQAYLDAKAKQRETIQKQINDLNQKREGYLRTERSKQAKPGQISLDGAVNGAVRDEAESSGFRF